MSPFVAMTNIENFNKGAMAYGLPKEATFQSGDLWEVRKSGFYNVLSSLHQLGFLVSMNSLVHTILYSSIFCFILCSVSIHALQHERRTEIIYLKNVVHVTIYHHTLVLYIKVC